jgi:hypothetical protein
MKQRLATYVALGVSIVTCCVTTVAPMASAATAPRSLPGTQNNSGQALEIAPPVMNLTGDPGQVIKTQLSIRDISSGSLLVSGQINDFTAAGEDGTPKIILDNSSVNSPYSIKTWVTTIPKVILKPKEIKSMPVTISIPRNASPGGHYGVVRFTATAPELEGQGVSLSASLGTLILVRVNGAVTEKMSVAEFSAVKDKKKGTLFQSTPITFVARMKNEGNIHEQPAGQVLITDMFNKPLAAMNINLPPRNVLPATIRRFEMPLDSSVIGNKKLFGRYHAALTVTYGTSKQTVTDSMYFWVIPYKLIGIAIVLIIIAFFVLRQMIRKYNQQIVSRAQGRTAPAKQPKPKTRKRK